MNLQESIRNDLKLFEDSVFAGFIAMYNGQKLEIDKEDADGIYDAKQLAIAHFKIPKSKQGLLAIEPAYNEEVNEDENQDYKVLETLATFRDLYQQIKVVDTSGYVLDQYKESQLRNIYHAIIENSFTIRSGKRQDIPDLDGSYYNHPID